MGVIVLRGLEDIDSLITAKGFTFRSKEVICRFAVPVAVFFWLLRRAGSLTVTQA